MARHLTIPRLGSPRIDHDLIDRVRKAKAEGVGDTFTMADRRGRRVVVTWKSDSDLYQRMMAAKGLLVRVGSNG
jgi:hypothetical protein